MSLAWRDVGRIAATLAKHLALGASGFFVASATLVVTAYWGACRGLASSAGLASLALGIIPLVAAYLGGINGLFRGAAASALDLERSLGLLRRTSSRVFQLLRDRAGEAGPAALQNLPLATLEGHLKWAIHRVLGEPPEGSKGLVGWASRRLRPLFVHKVEAITLARFRADFSADGQGGGIDLARVEEAASARATAEFGDFVMARVAGQTWLFGGAVAIVSVLAPVALVYATR